MKSSWYPCSWSAFNSSLTGDAVVRPSVIGYLPMLPTSPTQLSTVYILLKRSLAQADKLKQTGVVVILDQAICASAQNVVRRHRKGFKCVVLHIGSFHITFTTLAVTGKGFVNSG